MKKRKRTFHDLMQKYRENPVEPPCPLFGECGGCLMQNISYEHQLRVKKEYLEKTLEGLCDVGEVRPSTPLRYRNRMDFVTAFGKTGLRKRGRYRQVVDVPRCALMQQRSDDALAAIRPHLAGIEDYDYLRHEGYLRYLVLRQGRYTGMLMANPVAARRENRVETLLESLCGIADSVSLILNEGKADLSFGEVLSDVKGGFIEERLGNLRFRIRPNSFFQSNSEIALSMYEAIRDETEGHVLDLYSGVGSISLFIADRAESVTGVEVLPEGVAAACENRELNGITGAGFICADAMEFLSGNTRRFDTLVMDPPRSGIHPKTLKLIATLAPSKIIYMSCNPVTFRDDCLALEHYRIEKFEACDMFPQTDHIETLAVLKRKLHGIR